MAAEIVNLADHRWRKAQRCCDTPPADHAYYERLLKSDAEFMRRVRAIHEPDSDGPAAA